MLMPAERFCCCCWRKYFKLFPRSEFPLVKMARMNVAGESPFVKTASRHLFHNFKLLYIFLIEGRNIVCGCTSQWNIQRVQKIISLSSSHLFALVAQNAITNIYTQYTNPTSFTRGPVCSGVCVSERKRGREIQRKDKVAHDRNFKILCAFLEPLSKLVCSLPPTFA